MAMAAVNTGSPSRCSTTGTAARDGICTQADSTTASARLMSSRARAQELRRVEPSDRLVVRDGQADRIDHLDAALREVADHQTSEVRQVRRHERDPPGADRLRPVHQGSGAGHDRRPAAGLGQGGLGARCAPEPDTMTATRHA